MKKTLAIILGITVGMSSVGGFAENTEITELTELPTLTETAGEITETEETVEDKAAEKAEPTAEIPESEITEYDMNGENGIALFEAATVLGNTVGENITDEFKGTDYLYSATNVETAGSDKYPMNVEGFGDTSTLWLKTVRQAADIVYRAENGKMFTNVYLEVSGNVNKDSYIWPMIEYSADGNAWNTLVDSFQGWDPTQNGWKRTDNASSGNGWQKVGVLEKALPENAVYIRVSLEPDSAKPSKDSFLFRKVKLEVEKVGTVSEKNYTEKFENLNFTDKCDGISAENGVFKAASESSLVYKAANGRAIKNISVSAAGISDSGAVRVYAADREEIKKDITSEMTVTESGGAYTFAGSLPSWAKSVELHNTEELSYTTISISTAAAEGFDWLYAASSATFTEDAEKLRAEVTVANEAQTAQSAGAYLVIYDGGTPKKIVRDTKSIAAGGSESLCAEVEKSYLTDSAYVILYVITDLKTGVMICDESVYKPENRGSEVAVDAEETTGYAPGGYVSDIKNSAISVFGKMPNEERAKKVLLTVLNPGYTAENADSAETDAAVNTMLAATADENGAYSAALRLRDAKTDTYRILASTKAHAGSEYTDIKYTRAEDMGQIWSDIAAAMKNGKGDELEGLLEKQIWIMLGVRSAELGGIDAAGVCRLIDGSPISGVEPTPDSIKYAIEGKALIKMLSNGEAAELIKKAAADSVAADVISGGNADAVPYKVFGGSSDAVIAAVAAALDGKSYSDVKAFRDSFATTVLSVSIVKAQNNLGVRKAMQDYSSLFTTDYSQKYAALGNTKRAKAETALQESVSKSPLVSVNDAAERFLKCIKAQSDSGSAGGGTSAGSGGSSGGSGGGVRTSVSASADLVQSTAGNTAAAGTEPFIDISDVPWARESILALEKRGIVAGREKMRFEPNVNITREEFVKILVAALDISADDTSKSFDDVADGDWFEESVRTAYGAGIVNGITEQFFGVGENITRQEMAAMVYRAAEKCGAELSAAEPRFTDSGEIAEYAYTAAAALYGSGIMNGGTDGSFAPNAFATRAEAAKVVYLTMSLCNKQEG